MRTLKLLTFIFVGLFYFSCMESENTSNISNNQSYSELNTTENIQTSFQNFSISKMNLEGNEIPVSTATYDQETPKTIYLPDKKLWFVVWADNRNGNNDIYGQFVKSDGTLCGSEIQLTNSPDEQTHPTVTYNGNGTIVFAWQDTRGSDTDSDGYAENGYIYVNSLDVSALDANCSNYSLGTSVAITYNQIGSDELLSRQKPDIKYDPVNDRYVLTYIEQRNAFSQITCFPTTNPTIFSKDNILNTYVGYAILNNNLTISKTDILRNDNNSSAIRAREISYNSSGTTETHIVEMYNGIDSVNVAVDTTSNTQFLIYEAKKQIVEFTCTDTGGNVSATINISNTNEANVNHIYAISLSNIKLTSIPTTRIDKDLDDNIPSHNPSVDFDPYAKRFLIAFENEGTDGNTKIYGQLLSSTGGLYGNNILVSYQDLDEDGQQDENILNSKQSSPSVGFDAVNQRFFVAWQDGRNSSVSLENLDIYGQYIDSEGSLRGNNYIISKAPFNQRNPSIAFNTSNNQYLAVWKDARNAQSYTCGNNNDEPCGSDIYGQRYSLGQPQIQLLEEYTDQNGNILVKPLQPALLDFGVLKVGESKSLAVRIKNTGDETLNIDCIREITTPALFNNVYFFENLPAELSACNDNQTISLAPGTYLRTTIRFSPTDDANYNTKLEIVSDAVENNTIELQGIGTLGDAITSVDKEALNFGSVVVNESKYLTFTLTNEGSQTININNITTPTGYSVTIGDLTPSYPIAVQPGTSIVFTVRFSPTATGVYSGTITVDTDANDINIYVVGTGVSQNVALSTNNINFGNVNVGSTIEQSFTITNTGQQDITINAVSGVSAPFSVVSVDGISVPLAIPKTLAPSQSATIKVSFTPSTYGSFSQTLTIDTSEGVLTVALSGTGTDADISLSTSALDFGSINANNSKTLSFDVVNSGNADATVNSCSVSNSAFSVQNCPATLTAGSTTTINVVFTPTDIADYTGTLTIKTDKGDYSVQLSGKGIGAASSTSALDFGSVVVNTNKYLTFTFTNNGNATININNITTPTGYSVTIGDLTPSYPIAVQPGTSIVFTVRFSPTATGVYSGTITVDTDANDINIYVVGTGVSQNVALSTNNINFGNVNVGSTIEQSFTITNTGQQDITINAVSGVSAPFSVVSVDGISVPLAIPKTLAPSQSATIKVSFTPSTYGSFSQTLTIDTSEGVLTVALSGTGTDADISLSTSALDFGSINANNSKTLSFDVVNSGNADATVNSCSVSNSAFSVQNCPTTLTAGSTTTINVVFTPTDIADYTGTLTIKTDKGDYSVQLSGKGTGLEVSTKTLNFGSVSINNSVTKTITITNTGSSDITINQINAIPDGYNIKIGNQDVTSGTTLNIKLPAGNSLKLYVTFAPAAEQTFIGSFVIDTDANDITIGVSGTGVSPSIAITSPAGLNFGNTLDFGDVQIGTSYTKLIKLKNNSAIDITLENIDNPLSPFTVEGITTPITLTPGQEIQVLVKFAPTEATVTQTSVGFLFNTDSNPKLIYLKGTGVSTSTTTAGTLSFEDINGNNINILGFGKVFIGDKKDITVRIANNTNSDITISSIDLGDTNNFSLLGLIPPSVIPANSYKEIKVSFIPTSIGNLNTTLTITDTSGNSIKIDLTGESTDFKISTDIGTVEDFNSLPTIPFSYNKPSTFNTYKAYSFKINTGDNQNEQTVTVSITLNTSISNPSVYKILTDGTWKKIGNITVSGNTISYQIKDNGELDTNPQTGIIEDPIVVGTETTTGSSGTGGTTTGTSTAPTIKEPSSSGGGCVMSNKTDYSLLVLLMSIAIILIRRVKR